MIFIFKLMGCGLSVILFIMFIFCWGKFMCKCCDLIVSLRVFYMKGCLISWFIFNSK